MRATIFFFTLALLPQISGAGDGLRLVISGPNEVKLGEAVEFKAALVNDSKDRTYRLVMPGDGSGVGWRTPIVGWTVTAEATGQEWKSGYLFQAFAPPERAIAGGRCGNVNALEESEIFSLAPGQTAALEGFLNRQANAQKKGKYRIKLKYTNDPHKELKGIPLGEHSQEALQQIKRSDAVELESNEIVVNVK